MTAECLERVKSDSLTRSQRSLQPQSQSGVTTATCPPSRLASATLAVPSRAATKCVVLRSTVSFTTAPRLRASRNGLLRSTGTCTVQCAVQC